MIRLLSNGSTIVKGGALQAYISFYNETINDSSGNYEWHYIVSREIYSQINKSPKDTVICLKDSPARNIASRKILLDIEKKINPQVVFTFFGPAYVKFKAPHLCGVADPWVTHSNRLALSQLKIINRFIKTPLMMLYKTFWFRFADAWVVEANVAKNGLIHRLRLPKERIFVVPNSCGGGYFALAGRSKYPLPGEKVRILCFSAYYSHKNLEIIPMVAREITNSHPKLDFEFVITLPLSHDGLINIMHLAERLGVEKHICNIGPVLVSDGPVLYQTCHICFLPSLLETFSANYPESMVMGRPLVTTDLDFARDVCGDAATYYDPANPRSAAMAILGLLEDRATWDCKVALGRRVVAGLPDPRGKYRQYCAILESLPRSRKEG